MLTNLRALSSLRHLIKLNACNNQITDMLDFDPPANLEFVDYSLNNIAKIDNVWKNKYMKMLYLDKNKIKKIEGLN